MSEQEFLREIRLRVERVEPHITHLRIVLGAMSFALAVTGAQGLINETGDLKNYWGLLCGGAVLLLLQITITRIEKLLTLMEGEIRGREQGL